MKKINWPMIGLGILLLALLWFLACHFIGTQEITEEPTVAVETDALVASSNYVDYSPEALQKAQDDGDDVALFFHSKTCTSCAALHDDILANAQDIPDTVTIVKTDRDDNQALAKKYDVANYHTVTYLDSSNNVKGLFTLDKVLNGFGAEEEIEEVAPLATVPAWFTYLQDNGYENTDLSFGDFDGDEQLSRASVTPYLWKYALSANLEKDGTRNCAFPDLGGVTDALKVSIENACAYGLMRGSEGKFLPNQALNKYELITILVRSKIGMIGETSEPRYMSYVTKARELEIIDATTTDESLTDTLTKKDLGAWLYNVSQL